MHLLSHTPAYSPQSAQNSVSQGSVHGAAKPVHVRLQKSSDFRLYDMHSEKVDIVSVEAVVEGVVSVTEDDSEVVDCVKLDVAEVVVGETVVAVLVEVSVLLMM